jgi:ubiquinone biosynthesis protein
LLYPIPMKDYSWVLEVAHLAKSESHSIATLISKAISKLRFDPITEKERRHAWLTLIRDLVNSRLDHEFIEVKNVKETILSLETLGIDHLNEDYLKEEKLYPIIKNVLDHLLNSFLKTPDVIEFLDEADLLEDILESITSRYFPWMKFIPFFSEEVMEILPKFKEPLFTAFYELKVKDNSKIIKLTEKILSLFYENNLRDKFKKRLSQNIKGEMLLLPLIDSAVIHLPAERCVTFLICLICTPRKEITEGRILSILLQELGGIYVKLAQILSELTPPHLARELKVQQNKLGGIFGSKEKSWDYVIELLNRPSLKKFREFIIIPEDVQAAYAGASVGTIYEFFLTPLGKKEFQNQEKILIKIQRPGLRNLFKNQERDLISLLDKLETHIDQMKFKTKECVEIIAQINTLKKSISQYASQTMEELDFTNEKKNSEIIKTALGKKFQLEIPHYFHVEEDVIIMEKVAGEKITSVVQDHYLQRESIADGLSQAYLYLMLQKGIVWADPHAGNILYDPIEHKLKLIDLNPCFILEKKTIKTFITFFYQLILKDSQGLLKTIEGLVENRENLKNDEDQKIIINFIMKEEEKSLKNFLYGFIRILGQRNINLKKEIQSTLRGISQLYITVGAISSRNNFGRILHQQLNWKIHLFHLTSIGPLQVLKASLSLTYTHLKKTIHDEIGPCLDERDISVLEKTITHLNKKNVCQIRLQRINPDENTQLKLLTDGTRLKTSASLKIEILNKSRPASVGYVIEVPEKEWLKERQEYIKLQGLGFVLCLVESLEQLRRNSLEEFWYVIEAWQKKGLKMTGHEKKTIGKLRVAARQLFTKRFSNIWTSEFMTISLRNKILWKALLLFEKNIEEQEAILTFFLERRKSDNTNFHVTFGTFYKIKILFNRSVLLGLKYFLKKSRFEMNLLPLSSDQLVQRMICGLVRKVNINKN